MKRSRGRSDDDGFTLIELIVTVVILGIIVAPLSMMLIQALTVVPTSGARTQAATDRDHLQETMTGDIAQATQLDVFPTALANGSQGATIPAVDATPWQPSSTWLKPAIVGQTTPCMTLNGNGATTITSLFSTVWWDASENYIDGSGHNIGGKVWTLHKYTLVFTPAPADVSGTPMDRVEVHRSSGSIDNSDVTNNVDLADDNQSYLVGYCKAGAIPETVATVATATALAADGTTALNEDLTVQLTLRDNVLETPSPFTVNGAVQVRVQ